MVSFGEARARTADIPVATPQQQGVVDQATAQAITAFGAIGGDLRRGGISGALRGDLEEASNITATLNAPETAVTEEGIDISTSDPTGTIDQASESFKRLAEARAQGTIDLNRASIEAETLLRQSIARAPGFAKEFRSIAADAIGFDVSGAATRQLFGNIRGGGGPKTALQKAREEAQVLHAGGFFASEEQAFQVIVEKQTRDLQEGIMSSKIRTNKTLASAGALEHAALFEKEVLDVLAPFAAQVDEFGGIRDKEDAQRQLAQAFRLRKARARADFIGNRGIIAQENVALADAQLQEVFDFFSQTIENDDLAKSLARNSDVLTNSITIEAMLLAPDLALLNRIGGDELVTSFLTSARSLGDDIKNIKRIWPELGASLERISQTNPHTQAKALANIMSRSGEAVSSADAEPKSLTTVTPASGTPDPALQADFDDFHGSEGDRLGDTERYSNSVGNQYDLGFENRPLSLVARTRNGYSKLKPEEQAKTQSAYQSNLFVTIENLAQELAGSDVQLEFNPEGRTFADSGNFLGQLPNAAQFVFTEDFALSEGTIQQRRGGLPTSLTQARFFGGPGGSAPGASPVNHINGVLLNILADPKAREDLGVQDVSLWSQQVIQAVQARREEIEQGTTQSITTTPQEVGDEFEGATVAGTGQVQRDRTGIFQDAEGNLFFPGGLQEVNAIQRITSTVGDKQVEVPKSRQKVADAIETAADEAGVPSALALALSKVESSFSITAQNPKSTAEGLFQNTKDNFTDFGPKDGTIKKQEDQIFAGVNFLKFLIDRFNGDLSQVLLHWHDGQNSTAPFSSEGKKFRDKVLTELGLE